MWADGCKVMAKYLQGKLSVGGLLQYLINQALTLVVPTGKHWPVCVGEIRQDLST